MNAPSRRSLLSRLSSPLWFFRKGPRQADEILAISDGDREAAIREELEASRERQLQLKEQVDRLRRMLKHSDRQLGLAPAQPQRGTPVTPDLAGAPPDRKHTG